jgi:hypothetical protein
VFYLTVVRDNARHIREVRRSFSKKRIIVITVISLALGVAGFCLLYWEDLPTNDHLVLGWRWLKLGILLSMAGIVGLAHSALRIFKGRSAIDVIADQSGIHLLYYANLSVVPWTAIRKFYLAEPDTSRVGKSVLVAEVAGAEGLVRRLRLDNPFAPGRRFALPFATVEGSGKMDVQALKAALEEFHRQTTRA